MRGILASLMVSAAVVAGVGIWALDAPPALAQEQPPIAGVGHGAFFDAKGNQIRLTPAFVARAQRWYRARLLAALTPGDRKTVLAQEKQMRRGQKLSGQAALVADQEVLQAIVARLPRDFADHETVGIINLLSYRLTTVVGEPGYKRFAVNPALAERLRAFKAMRPGGGINALVTTNSGQAYIDECRANRVPIPPAINVMDTAGVAGWRIEGEIPTNRQFIENTPAEVRVFTSADGMCIALPRYTDGSKTRVMLDGVVCQSSVTSKVCFWDNQMNTSVFEFGATERIPIGVPDLTVNAMGRYQAGGNELLMGGGGVCTGCHAGENAYIVHPEVILRPATPTTPEFVWQSMAGIYPMFPPQRYDPIVPAAWPQNALSMSPTLVPGDCIGCHVQGGSGGRLPHLSTALRTGPNYCGSVLRPAVAGRTFGAPPVVVPGTMPQFAGGSLAADPAVLALIDWCDEAPSAGPSDRGDPHVTTTNGVNYDFHAAGEFVALRNAATGFEVQTRQTPVLTGFRAGTNAHTGLDGCVSVNTAAAVRVGKRRVTIMSGDQSGRERMVVRIDGRPVRLAAGKVDLGGGAVALATADGMGLDVRSGDGDRVVVTPLFWESQGVWYVNVDVTGSAAREGVMGTIPGGDWLPLADNGGSFGGRPAAAMDRHVVLNEKFADVWRVKANASLFDYAAGTSTATFTDAGWPAAPGGQCSTSKAPGIGTPGKIRPLPARVAKRVCAAVGNAVARRECMFDAMVMGDEGIGQAYARTLANRAAP